MTGAAYEMAALMAIELATGWNPNDADVVIGTSSGAFVTALVRHDALDLDSLVLPSDDRADVADRIRSHIYTRSTGLGVREWMRHGVLPGLRRPGLRMLLGSPAPYEATGIAEWVTWHIGDRAGESWPEKPTAVVAYDILTGTRVAFGTVEAPDCGLADAVAASSAIPLVFRPYPIGPGLYVDGGVASGTHVDLVLGHPEPLDLVLVLAPMAAEIQRRGALFYEKMFDRVGLRSLNEELDLVRRRWPRCDVVVLSPSSVVQNVMRPNPMDPSRAVPTFMRTLMAMKRTLARSAVWAPLESHLVSPGPKRAVAL